VNKKSENFNKKRTIFFKISEKIKIDFLSKILNFRLFVEIFEFFISKKKCFYLRLINFSGRELRFQKVSIFCEIFKVEICFSLAC